MRSVRYSSGSHYSSRKREVPGVYTAGALLFCLALSLFVGFRLDKRASASLNERAALAPRMLEPKTLSLSSEEPLLPNSGFADVVKAFYLPSSSAVWRDGELISRASMQPGFSLARITSSLTFTSELTFFEILFSGSKNGVYHLRLSPKKCELSFAVMGKDRMPISAIPCALNLGSSIVKFELNNSEMNLVVNSDSPHTLPLQDTQKGYAGFITNLTKSEVVELVVEGQINGQNVEERL